jgi:PAS domain S-box-containing protein
VIGYTTDEFATFDAFEIVHPDERREVKTRFDELTRQPGKSVTAVNRVRHKDGSWRWVEAVFMNALDAPKMGAVIANFRDVTEWRRALDAVREAEEKFRGIVESATEFAIFTTDLDGRIDSWNSGAKRLLGYDDSEAIGQDFRILFTQEDNATDQPEAEMRDALLWGSGNDERWHVRKDGGLFWGSGLTMPLRDEAGGIRGYLKIFRDMTAAKQAEDALKDADRRKDQFLAILAHEIRNPLAAIRNAALVMEMQGSEETLRWTQGVISRNSNHLSRLLEDLLDSSRVTQGKIQLRKERLDLNEVIRRAVESVKPLFEEKKHTFTLDAPAAKTIIEGDAARIEQILVNLLTNAAKYTDSGGDIRVALRRADKAIITVQDNGIGIAPDMVEQIFEPFAQVEKAIDRSQGGLGVGLTLARSLVELHGGTIEVKSAGVGQGSAFSFSLPLADEVTTEPAAPDSRLACDRGLRILVVDDNRDSALGLARILEHWGYDVKTAHDGPSAIELARTDIPDVVLLDIGLPGLDGYQVAKRLKQDEALKAPKLIAISGYGQEEDRRRSREAGFDHHLVKPADLELLSTILSTYGP